MDRSLVLLLHLNYDHRHGSSIVTFSIIATLKLQTQKVELHLKKFQPETYLIYWNAGTGDLGQKLSGTEQ